jgi:hypothetical protein
LLRLKEMIIMIIFTIKISKKNRDKTIITKRLTERRALVKSF